MPKTKISDMLKSNKGIGLNKFSPNDPEYQAMIKAVKREQKMASERKIIDRKKLDNTIINV